MGGRTTINLPTRFSEPPEIVMLKKCWSSYRVAAAGGLRAYEKAHRHALATTLTRVAFPSLPVDVVSHVVAFSFHTGYY